MTRKESPFRAAGVPADSGPTPNLFASEVFPYGI